MFSYAVKGAGIGAHVDNYDVFLLQGKGSREWAIEEEFLSAAEELSRKRTDVDVHLLKRFQPQRVRFICCHACLFRCFSCRKVALQSWELGPGDMLYLPPRIPHRGVALDDECITISFGMRDPHKDEMFGAFTSELLQGHIERELLPDAHLPSVRSRGSSRWKYEQLLRVSHLEMFSRCKNRRRRCCQICITLCEGLFADASTR
jgi:50S ribosomal protein L16 3-hydroxylase